MHKAEELSIYFRGTYLEFIEAQELVPVRHSRANLDRARAVCMVIICVVKKAMHDAVDTPCMFEKVTPQRLQGIDLGMCAYTVAMLVMCTECGRYETWQACARTP